MLGGFLIFSSDPGFFSICGAVGALCGMSVYTSLNLKESKEAASKQLPKQIPKTKTDVNSVEIADLNILESV